MKKFLILFAFINCALVQAQELLPSQVPQPVLVAFKKANPTATNTKWTKSQQKFQAKFIVNRKEKVLTYTNSGTLVVNDDKVAIATLPLNVKIYLDKFYAGKTIDKVLKMTNKNGSINYLVGVSSTDLIFDSKGYYVKSVKE